ncbi:MAG: hypothetical protein IT380_27435 [Myxococcales bacterium]|nr:hypothetical protein [Myxococcales bacterium]
MGQLKRKEKHDAIETDAVPGPAANESAPAPWSSPARPSRVSLGVIAAVVLLVNLPLVHFFLLRPAPKTTVTLPFTDDYSDPSTVAQHYWSSGGLWRTVDGWLLSPGVKNNPLWLQASLPQDVAVEFDVKSMSAEGDIKVELFGDGSDHASGYVLIHGGWNNSISIIARLDEHAPSLAALNAEAQKRGGNLVSSGVYNPGTRVRVEANPFRVEQGRSYHWRIERRGSVLTWSIDGQPFMSFDDPFPLAGKGHDRFGFSSWEAQLFFDNLRVTPL